MEACDQKGLSKAGCKHSAAAEKNMTQRSRGGASDQCRFRSAQWLLVMVVGAQWGAVATHPANLAAAASKLLAEGACLRVMCDMSGGLPLEHWKLRLVMHPEEAPLEALRNVGCEGGGLSAYWRGAPAKLIEGSTGGAMLLAGKECAAHVIKSTPLLKLLPLPLAGALAGACGGLSQAIVMQPTTMIVTSAQATGQTSAAIVMATAASPGGIFSLWLNPAFVSVAARQISNWASRVGLTELARAALGANKGTKSFPREVAAGVLGGALSCWNTPFEVCRIKQQSETARHIKSTASRPTGPAGSSSAKAVNTWETMRQVYREAGVRGLFAGVEARVGQAVWQTIFMQVFPRFLR
jgi:hypothetical protein